MSRHLLLPALCALLSSPAPLHASADNAATLYRAAFEAMRPFTEEEQSFLAAAVGKDSLARDTPPPTAEATALLNDFAPALALFAKAAQYPHCDWEVDITQGPHTKFDHLTPLLNLSRLTALQCRLNIGAGDFPAAIGNVRLILQTNQQITTKTPFFLELLVQHSLQTTLVNTLTCDLSNWIPEPLTNLQTLLATQPPPPHLCPKPRHREKILRRLVPEKAQRRPESRTASS